MPSELNSKQWVLYSYLKDHYEPNKFISKKEIANAIGYEWNDKSDRNGRDIEHDIQKINDSEIIQKVIISSPKGYKIANSEEAERWLETDKKALVKAFERYKHKCRKIKKDGQMRLVFNNERDTIEAYPKDKN